MELFNVYQFFRDDSWERVREHVPAQEAVRAAHHYCSSVGARVLGTTVRVIITDMDDFTCFEWRRGEGVVFPPECAGREPDPSATFNIQEEEDQ